VTEVLTYAISLVLVVMPIINALLVIDSVRLYRSDPERSPILLALLWINVVIWVVGILFSMFSIRFLLDIQPVFPANGVLLAVALLAVNLLPVSIYWVVRRYERH